MLALCCVLRIDAQTSVLTWHNDNARTGLNTNETILSLTNVNQNGFGRLFSQPVDGPVYAQPLYVPNVAVPGKGTHNLVFVATQHDSVYAFDADSRSASNAAPLWHVSFLNPAAGVVSVSTLDAVDFPGEDCQTFVGEIGIVGTPVVDSSSGTLYVVARTKEPGAGGSLVQVQRLHALDITNGQERSYSPVPIEATVSGSGIGSSGNMLSFNPAREVQRSALLLQGGVVYIAWASYCDLAPYHGWIIGYDAHTFQQVGVLNVTPNGSAGGIWMGGGGLSGAPDGSIYCLTGNGTFDTSASPTNFGNSFLKLVQGSSLTVTDYFTPFNQASLDVSDTDLGSGGALVLPDSVGSLNHPHLVIGCGKEGQIYLLDRDNMGHFNSRGDTQIVQKFALFSSQTGQPYFFGGPAFFNNRVYFQCVNQSLKAFAITNGLLNRSPVSQTVDTVGFRGSIPSITADGVFNAIVWQIIPGPPPGIETLRAYNATNLTQKLYDSYLSTQAGASDLVSFVKFTVPTIANGKVFLGGLTELAVFGLRNIIWSATRDIASGSIKIVFSGPTGMQNVLQSSSDLVHWTDLGTGTANSVGTYEYTDPIAAGPGQRFYRVNSR